MEVDQAEVVNYSALKVVDLKSELKLRHLPVSGKKSDLIERLEEDDLKLEKNGSVRCDNGEPADIVNTTSTSLLTSSSPPISPAVSRSTSHDTAASGDEVLKRTISQTSDISPEMRQQEKEEREHITLFKRPLTTLQYFVLECGMLALEGTQRLVRAKAQVLLWASLAVMFYTIYVIPGPHQIYVSHSEKTVLWCLYWVGLGVLSSVGLGTGLHTFLLYLGPHIASVTLAGYECESVDFPEPPYPDSIVCPENDNPEGHIGLWDILSKVRLEAFMWGAGTALGELPPYFMARAARLSGSDETDDDDLNEFEELLEEAERDPTQLSRTERVKLAVHQLVKRVGFWGILVCASIPNPLFDLAGITCGHFLVPFWTFFGATLIGKAIIKMHIQKLFVIFLFSEHHVDQIVSLIKYIPVYGKTLQQPFKLWLKSQKTKLHRKPGSHVEESGPNVLAWIFEKLVMAMVAYFVLSIVTSLAQSYHKRLCAIKHERLSNEKKNQ